MDMISLDQRAPAKELKSQPEAETQKLGREAGWCVA